MKKESLENKKVFAIAIKYLTKKFCLKNTKDRIQGTFLLLVFHGKKIKN